LVDKKNQSKKKKNHLGAWSGWQKREAMRLKASDFDAKRDPERPRAQRRDDEDVCKNGVIHFLAKRLKLQCRHGKAKGEKGSDLLII